MMDAPDPNAEDFHICKHGSAERKELMAEDSTAHEDSADVSTCTHIAQRTGGLSVGQLSRLRHS